MRDREKVIEELGRLSEWLFLQYQVVYDGDAPDYYDAYKTVDDALSLLKEQEPKHGHWIEGEEALAYEGVYGDDYIVCSECKKAFCIMDNCTEEFDFCPHCGADMMDRR